MITKYFYLGIFFLALLLRFYDLGINPPSLTWDEAAWGYNAFSLLHTGKDEFGRVFPLDYLESFGDFKPPMYAYLTVLPVAIFGLTEFSARFASAFLGGVTVLITYFLVKRIFQGSEKREVYALLSSLFLAISPWHINLSRAAFEANVATFFLVTGVWLFFLAVQKNMWYLLLSAASVVFSLYTFNTARIVGPLLFIVLTVIFRKNLLSNMKQLITASIVGALLLLPMLPFLLSPHARLRFQEVNIFSDSNPVIYANEQIARNNEAFWSKIIDNRRVFYAREFVKHYFDNISPSFLFIKGDGNPKFSTRQVGELYLVDAIFFIAGWFLLFRKKEGKWYLLPLWFLIGILPAATARETPHALRIETVLPVPQIIVAYGAVQLFAYGKELLFIKKWKLANLMLIGFFICLFLNVFYYLHDYYTHYPKTFSGEWQYGYKEALAYAQSQENTFNEIFFTTDLGRPYAYYLFYSKLPPEEFQKNSLIIRDSFGFVSVEKVGKYSFKKDFPKERTPNKKVLYVNSPSKIPPNATMLKTFYLLNGEKALVAYILS